MRRLLRWALALAGAGGGRKVFDLRLSGGTSELLRGQRIEPGATWSPTWRIGQPAATLWYLPHPQGRTADHVYRGLAGMLIVDDPAASGRPLPQRYGVDDIPLIIQDERLHDVSFKLLELDGRAPPPPLDGQKDIVLVPPGATARLLVRFGDYDDPDTPYMFHCHLLEHEDRGMMGQFVIAEPGPRMSRRRTRRLRRR